MRDFLEFFTELQWEMPWALAGLLFLPLLARWFGKTGPLPSVTVPSLAPLRALGRVPQRRSGRYRWVLPLLALGLMIVALARPRTQRGDLPDPTKGIDIMLTLDYSRSMAEHDYQIAGKRVSRRDALFSVVKNFIGKRPNDRIGIVCFARSPFLVSPLTLDHEWSVNSLMETDFATGTAIGEGLAASMQFLKRNSDRSKVIILVTDGENMAGRRPIEIAPALLRNQVRVYSILIGPAMVGSVAAANHELNKTSRMTGGQFFQARDTVMLAKVYDLIDQLEKKALLQKRYVTWHELYPFLVAAALALLLADWLWQEILRRRMP